MTSSNDLVDSRVILAPSKDCDLMVGVCAIFVGGLERKTLMRLVRLKKN